MSEFDADRMRVNIARDLREVVLLYDDLMAEALVRYADSELPGGDALVMAGPAARFVEWESQIDVAERLYFEGLADWIELADDDTDPAPPLLVLGKWEEAIRDARNQPTGLRVTVPRAADYIRASIDWCLDADRDGRLNFLPIDEVAREINDLRSRMEAVLHDGIRHDSSAAACFKDVGTPSEPKVCGGRLVRRTLQRRDCVHVARAIDMSKGKADPVMVLRQTLLSFPEDEAEHRECDQGGRDEVYRCKSCGGFFTEAEYWLCVASHYERQAG